MILFVKSEQGGEIMYIYFYGFHALLPSILDFSSSLIYFHIDIYVHDNETLFTHAQ